MASDPPPATPPPESGNPLPLGEPSPPPAPSEQTYPPLGQDSFSTSQTPDRPAGQSEPTPVQPASPNPLGGEAPQTETLPSAPPEQGEPQPATDMPVATEAFVVPPSGEAPKANAANPFIPQGVVPDASGAVAPTSVVPPGNPLGRRLMMIAVFLVLIVLVVLGGKFVLGLIAGSQPVTITYWGLWEDDAIVRNMLTEFESSHGNIKVQYVKQSPQQYRERLQAYINKGDGPDVFRFHNTWTPMLRNELAQAPTSVMTASEFSSTFYPVATNDLVGGQTIYGLPMMIDGLGLYYNEDLFASAGVTPPTTWEDVLNIVPKLTVKNGDTILTSAIALGTTGNVENFSDIVATMMMQNGAKLTAPTGTQAEEALIFYRKFASPSDPVYTWNDTMDNSIYAFATGKVAMIMAPSWRAFDIKQIAPNLRFKIVPIPQLPGNTVTWASYWVEGVSTKSKYFKQAWEFVRYLTSKDTVSKLYTSESTSRLFGEPYARVELASILSADPYVGAYITQAKTAKSFPLASRTFDNGINDKMIKYLQDAVNAMGTGTGPAEALSTTAQGFQQVLGGYGLTTGTAPTTSP
ncbi:hypothetical protein A2Z00_00620 [Candidatus Gottesmanbacteria bacterium RBG_13_45_10]|uniref:Extracellular solute-binding protein n=1 Tax=Candidatus Gottesmanbacteria bacterium RBG_13_45_10 TaxID=1798370 RepID=A0A1F5ZHA2_9BACT|nr:MAG: hypothetical protein A2Z00_00620 [Candidatus Gottesmanbacteria bacterium RBG_13_45_10]